jgi:PIN domain nuclease of toxin-antitoxin system
MKLLLDTHTLLWWFFDDNRLSAKLRACIKNPDNEILASSASVWEISTKRRLGKLPQAGAAVDRFAELISKVRMS